MTRLQRIKSTERFARYLTANANAQFACDPVTYRVEMICASNEYARIAMDTTALVGDVAGPTKQNMKRLAADAAKASRLFLRASEVPDESAHDTAMEVSERVTTAVVALRD